MVDLGWAGKVVLPEFDASEHSLRDLSFKLIITLDEGGAVSGEWLPELQANPLKNVLSAMLLTRAFDVRLVTWLMIRARPLINLVNQIFNKTHDPPKGKHVRFSSKRYK